MGEIRYHLTNLVKDLCKSRLRFDDSFHFEGLLGVTLDDTSVLLVNISDSFKKTDGSESGKAFQEGDGSFSLKVKASSSAVVLQQHRLSVDDVKVQRTDGSSVHVDLGDASGAVNKTDDCFPERTSIIPGLETAKAQLAQANSPLKAASGSEQQRPIDGFDAGIVAGEGNFNVLEKTVISSSADMILPDNKPNHNQPNGPEDGDGTGDGEGTRLKIFQDQNGPSSFNNGSDSMNTGDQGRSETALNGLVVEDKIDITQYDDGVRWFKCDLCGYQSRFKKNLKRHLFTHESVGFPCKTCKKHFRDVTMLAEHIRVAHDNVSISCGECGKGFKTRRALQYHRQKHSGQFKYTCAECGKKFATTTHYSDHMNTHSGAREVCDSCGKSFQYKSSYNKHLRAGCKPVKQQTIPVLPTQPQGQIEVANLKTSFEVTSSESLNGVLNGGGLHTRSENYTVKLSVETAAPENIQNAEIPMQTTGTQPSDNTRPMYGGIHIGPQNYGHNCPSGDLQQITGPAPSLVPQKPPDDQLNGDLSLSDSFIDRMASSLDAEPNKSKTVGNPCNASFTFVDLVSCPALHTKDENMNGFAKIEDNPLLKASVPMQVGDLPGQCYPELGVSKCSEAKAINEQLVISQDLKRTSDQMENSSHDAVTGGVGTSSESSHPTLMDVTNNAEQGTKNAQSSMMWPNEDLVLYRFPLLEQEYAMQAASIEESTREQAAAALSEQPVQAFPTPRQQTSATKPMPQSSQDIQTESNYPETYYIYPLPQHYYDSDSFSACLTGVELDSPHLLTNVDLETQKTVVVDKVPTAAKANGTTDNYQNIATASEPVSNQEPVRDETALAVHNLVTLHSNISQDGESQSPVAQSLMYPSPDNLAANGNSCLVENAVVETSMENSSEPGRQLDVAEQYVGAIYPQFPEHMPPNIFDDDP